MEIYRDIIGAFNDWRRTSDRKPLLLGGARQVGKTWVMFAGGTGVLRHGGRLAPGRCREA